MPRGLLTRPGRTVPLALALSLLLPAAPAGAQTELRHVVVPAEGSVVIPPRSAPRLAARPAGTGAGIPIPPGAARGTGLLPDGGGGLAASALSFALPALAGALLGGGLAGSKNGSSAPARTR